MAQVSLCSQPEVEAMFAGFDLVSPGMVGLPAPHQRRDPEDSAAPNAGYGGPQAPDESSTVASPVPAAAVHRRE
ncbi:hypothetical protein [Saccharopolyspora spinosa]|uniref:hypothetical protein n=1 Tax=Saccharopolyspora spinosa TaxID=60894 RepID=UPI00376EB8AC